MNLSTQLYMETKDLTREQLIAQLAKYTDFIVEKKEYPFVVVGWKMDLPYSYGCNQFSSLSDALKYIRYETEKHSSTMVKIHFDKYDPYITKPPFKSIRLQTIEVRESDIPSVYHDLGYERYNFYRHLAMAHGYTLRFLTGDNGDEVIFVY